MNQKAYKYWAFISYSHSDEKWASWLHRRLETYRLPKQKERDPKRASLPDKLYPVFRDRDELPAGASLGEHLTKALDNSRNLVVICSKKSAQSKWVNEEIKHFKKSGRALRVFCLIVDGEPFDKSGTQECFPQAIRYEVDEAGEVTSTQAEPLAADARPGKDGKQSALLKIISGIAGLGFDELKRRDNERSMRRMRLVMSGSVAMVALFSFLSVQLYWKSVESNEARKNAEEAQNFAEEAQRQTEVQRKASAALNLLKSDPKRALKLAHEANLENVNLSKKDEAAVTLSLTTTLSEARELRRSKQALPKPGLIDLYATHERLSHSLEAFLERNEDSFKCMAWNGAAHKLYIGNDQGELLEVDKAAAITQRKKISDAWLLELEFSRSGEDPLVAGGDNYAYLFNAQMQEQVRVPVGSAINAIALNEATRTFAVATGDFGLPPYVQLYDFDGNDLGYFDTTHTLQIESLDFSPDGQFLLTGSTDRTARLWSIEGYDELQHPLSNNNEVIHTARFSANGSYIAIGGKNRSIALWTLDGKVLEAPLVGHSGEVIAITFNDLSTEMTSLSMDGEVITWSYFGGLKSQQNLPTSLAEAQHLEYDPRTGKLYFFSYSSYVRIWDYPGYSQSSELELDDFVRGRVTLLEDGAFATTSSGDTTIRYWNSDGSLRQTLNTKQDVLSFCIRDDGVVVHGGSYYPSSLLLHNWDGTEIPLQTDEPSQMVPHKIYFSPQTRCFYTFMKEDNRPLYIYDYHGSLLETITLDDGMITEIGINADRTRLIAGMDTGALYLVDLEDGHSIRKLSGHNARIAAVALSPDSKRLASTARDNTLFIQTIEGEPLTPFLSTGDQLLSCLEFSPDGDWLWVASISKAHVELWAASQQSWMRMAEQRLNSTPPSPLQAPE